MLSIANLRVLYDNVVEGVRDTSLNVRERQIVTLLGANGSGKSTTLKAISGILYPEKGHVSKGSVEFLGQSLLNRSPQSIVALGVVQVPEGRRLFDTLTVEENLVAGAITLPRKACNQALERVFDLFPQIAEHRRRVSGYLSGGQQQMVAIGRALMSQPRLLMLDEPSLGLAPQIVDTIFATIQKLRDEAGVTVLLIEQNARLALSVADHAYIMDGGRIVLDGPPAMLLANDDIREFYLGMGQQGQRRSMREVKHYRRRKRWLS